MPRLENVHARVGGTLVVGHLIAITIGAAQEAQGYDGTIAAVVGLAFELLAYLGLGVTLVFRVLLPRVGLELPRILIDLFTMVGVLVVFIAVGNRGGFSVAGLITT